MSKYIKGFNKPYLKYQTTNITRIINIDEIRQLKYYDDRAFLVYKDGSDDEILVGVAKELDDFLMNYRMVNIPLPGGVPTDIVTVNDEQTLQEWLEENGQS